MKKLVLAVLLSGLLVLAACSVDVAPAAVTIPSGEQKGLSVSGEGKVSAVPDVVLLQLGIEAEAKTVAQAQDLARGAMNRVQQALTSKGVAQKDIQTQRFSIQAVTEFIEEPLRKGRVVIVGYRVSNTVLAKVRQVDRAGEVIDAVADAGGDLTRIQAISFTIDDPAALVTQAREKALKDAQAKARQMTDILGVKLGKPIFISESTPFFPPPQPFKLEAGVAAPSTPISPGELEINVTVQIRFAIE